jgi:hypothetical protein
MKKYALNAILQLSGLAGPEYAKTFVELRVEFFRRFQGGLLTSTVHGAEFFENVLAYVDQPKTWLDQFANKNLELEKNFVRILEINT